MASLKRALKIANSAKQQVNGSLKQHGPNRQGWYETLYRSCYQVAATARTNDSSYVSLYIEIFEHYVFYFDRGVENFTASVLQPVLDLIQGEISGAPKDADAARNWARTLKSIEQTKAKAEGELKAKYDALVLPLI